eukprot:3628166-Pyramimonas_sp.AAC.1
MDEGAEFRTSRKQVQVEKPAVDVEIRGKVHNDTQGSARDNGTRDGCGAARADALSPGGRIG